MNQEAIDIAHEILRRRAVNCFNTFRSMVSVDHKKSWFQDEVGEAMQTFAESLLNGEKPTPLIIQAPPQNGKSTLAVQLIAWIAGKNPDKKTIYTSFSSSLGVRANLTLQRLYDSEVYKSIFPETKISQRTDSGGATRNRDVIEYIGREGVFRNTTVGGSITGQSLDLGIIDDPIKGRSEANSITKRNAAWDWLTDDFFTRFSESAGMLAILTRWHVDDPIGRFIERYPNAKVLSYEAIATLDSKHRLKGEALFPEHKSLEFLLERKNMMDSASWESLYQQNPFISGGEMIKMQYLKVHDEAPLFSHYEMFADTAMKTGQENDFSVFQFWGYTREGVPWLLDQARGRYEAPELLTVAKAFYKKCKKTGNIRSFNIEDKASGTGLIQTLKREKYPIRSIQRNKDKISRLNDVLVFMENDSINILSADWNSDYISELVQFPMGKHDDQVDPTMDAFTSAYLTNKNNLLSAMAKQRF